MITIRPMKHGETEIIKSWPPYPPPFEMMDYALRDGGWLDGHRGRPGVHTFTALYEHVIAGFSLLIPTGADEAEFRIALHPNMTGKGLGMDMTLGTLEYGFGKLGLKRIHLIVRKSNPKALTLYLRAGFKISGESVHGINGENVEFTDMEISRASPESGV